MKIIIGLGNPGKEYENTKHNAGFMAIDCFAQKNSFPEFKNSKKYGSFISEGIFNGEKIVLAEPQTFMNNSGIAAAKIVKNSNIKIDDIILVHDDSDLELRQIKISKARNSAGHKGVDSIMERLGSKDLCRLRLGIRGSGENAKAEELVLKKFKKEEMEIFKEEIQKSVLALEAIIKEGIEKAMQEYN
jgi:peptidyl-tRNA hydrolase, PTH1 family